MKLTPTRRNMLSFAIVFFVFGLARDGVKWLAGEPLNLVSIIKSVLVSVFIAVLVGLLFGGIIQLFQKAMGKGNITAAQEDIILQGPANHLKGIEGVGGHLALLCDRLVFRSHKFNIQSHEAVFLLADIAAVEEHKTTGLINNGLLLQLRNGRREKFTVEQAAHWVTHIHRCMSAQSTA